MSNIEEKAKALNAYLLSLDLIKEYQKYEALIKQNKELAELEEKMKDLQKEIVNKKAKQDESVVETIETYEKIKEKLEGHPLIINFLYLQEEVDILLQDINLKINGQLSV